MTGRAHFDSPPIDLDHLARQTMGSAALANELLDLFAAQSGACLEKIEAAGCAAGAAERAHALKGAARAVGAFAVADAAEAIERTDDASAYGAQVALLRKKIDEATYFIAAWRHERRES